MKSGAIVRVIAVRLFVREDFKLWNFSESERGAPLVEMSLGGDLFYVCLAHEYPT